ncbi:hypothetical protein P8V03_15250 [Clostridium sp. A1-XYC3]|uniref:Uncharacterized protein n=1 Tax=Clostridium tanneri TaxID=3037988 RepID=A0ABU4JWK2_9CLOT|nr:hypothetical protein [Clostridium sp. A1-XYC3]MDW8802503.1 hypothetical protein [Clostridium sp. A1-XYC3]
MSWIDITEEDKKIFEEYNLPAFEYLYLWQYLSTYQRYKANRISDLLLQIEYVINGLNRTKRLPPNYKYLLKGKRWNGFEGIIIEKEEHPPYYVSKKV